MEAFKDTLPIVCNGFKLLGYNSGIIIWVIKLVSAFVFFHLQPMNTLFMHYFAAKQEFSHGSAREIIR